MQIQIDAQPIGPLRLLPMLPDARLAVLEGLNGIGKTLTVRLLQVCTGTMPYRLGAPAWTSLCNGLGRFRVHASNLYGAESIEWVADTREWLGKDDVNVLPYQRILIDGKQANLEDVRSLVVVHRLAGDETLIETLAQQADGYEVLVHRWRDTAGDGPESPMIRMEVTAAELLRKLGEWTSLRYSALLRDVVTSQTEFASATASLNASTEWLEKLRHALEVHRRMERLREIGPQVTEQLHEVDSEITRLNSELALTQEKVVRVARRTALTESVLPELANAQRTLKRNQDKLTRFVDLAATTASELGIAPARRAIEHEVIRLQQEIASLEERRHAVDTAPAIRTLLDDTIARFQEGERRGLSTEIALDDPETDLQLTVEQTRIGFSSRRAQLDSLLPPPDVREILVHLSTARYRLERVQQLSRYLDAIDRHRRLAERNEQRIDKALAKADPSAFAELHRLEAERRNYDATLLELAERRATLRQQLGDLGEEQPDLLEAQHRSTLAALNVAVDDLEPGLEGAERAEQVFRVALDDARTRLANLKREVTRAEADIKRTYRSLFPAGELEWISLAVSFKGRSESDDVSVETQLSTIDVVRAKVESAIERVGKHRTQLLAIARALRGIGRHLRGQDPEAVEYVPELERWFGSKFSEWFNSGHIRTELLREADGPIQVDVRTREVVWLEKGRSRSRPLEAFSSGEQAFAYTRARLASLDEDAAVAPNRLIVLDEFGAFIAHDRLSRLLSDLHNRLPDHPCDQVLVVLPLSHDYATEAMNAVGDQRAVLQHLADQIALQRFGIRVLAP